VIKQYGVKKYTINDICKVIDCEHKTAPYVDKSDFLVARTANIKGGELTYEGMKFTTQAGYSEWTQRAVPECGDILFTREAPAGESCLVPENLKVCMGQRMVLLRPNRDLVDPLYFFNYLMSGKCEKEVNKYKIGTTVSRINIEDIKKIPVRLPDLHIQKSLASGCTSINKRISLLKQKHEQLVLYKKGIMQQLFSQQLRFKDDDGQDFPGWVMTKFKQHFERVTQKNIINNLNVLTISGKRGLINQQKYFNKSVSAQDVTGYYLINKGEFAYNKSYSKGYPMGAIKRLNNYDQGVVSTLYICFKSKNGDERFWEQYFEVGLLNREIQKIAQEGARNHGLLNVSVKEFFDDMKMHSPCNAEQTKIADFLEVIDQKINLAQQQIEQTQAYKQGLLQQMFV